jgi:hypothetical protein
MASVESSFLGNWKVNRLTNNIGIATVCVFNGFSVRSAQRLYLCNALASGTNTK